MCIQYKAIYKGSEKKTCGNRSTLHESKKQETKGLQQCLLCAAHVMSTARPTGWLRDTTLVCMPSGAQITRRKDKLGWLVAPLREDAFLSPQP